MAKNTLATFGILAVLLLSFGFASAAQFTFDEATTLPTTGAIGQDFDIDYILSYVDATSDFTLNFSTNDDDWSGLPSVAQSITLVGNSTVTGTAVLTIPAGYSEHIFSTTLKARLTNGTYGHTYSFPISITIPANEVALQDGCTDPDATNTNTTEVIEDNTLCTYTQEPLTFCEQESYIESTGDLEISDFDVNNNGEGSDDLWNYLDQLEIVVEVENTHDEDNAENVEVTILILDEDGADVTGDFDFDKETLTGIGRLRDGDKEEVVFTVDELSSELEDGDYTMYLMVSGEDKEGEEHCTSDLDKADFYFPFTIESIDYEDSILAGGSDLIEQVDTYCGQQNLEITVPIYNLGSDDEEKVLVNLYSSKMGIDTYEIINDLDDGDKEVITFFIDVPSALEKERYDLEIITSFDWDDEREEEVETSYEEQTSESIRLNILGCSAPAPTVTASLGSDPEVGSNIIVKATVTNNGDLNNFIVKATGFEDWADLISLTPSTLEIASGNTQEVTIVLSPKQFGVQTFKITTTVDGETYSQPISVNIAEKQYPLGMNKMSFYFAIASATLAVLILLVLITRLTRRPVAAASF